MIMDFAPDAFESTPISIRAISAHPKRRSRIRFPPAALSRDADGRAEGAVADEASPHPCGVGLCWPEPRLLAGDLRKSTVLSCASWCQLPRAAPEQLIEFTGYPEPTAQLTRAGSRVRVPSSPPIKSIWAVVVMDRLDHCSGHTGSVRQEIHDQRGRGFRVFVHDPVPGGRDDAHGHVGRHEAQGIRLCGAE